MRQGYNYGYSVLRLMSSLIFKCSIINNINKSGKNGTKDAGTNTVVCIERG